MNRSPLLAIAFLILASLACQFASDLTATDTPLPSDTPTDTATPLPSETPTPRPTLDLTATADARATSEAAEILTFVGPALEDLGYSTNNGRLAWYDLSANELEVATSFSTIYDVVNPGAAYEDFILSVDVTWDSETGLAGCGIIFRAEEDLQRGRQAQFFAYRFSGLPAWSVYLYEFGEFRANLLGGYLTSAAIRLSSGSTNTFVLIGQGQSVTAYANGIRLGGITLPEGMQRGGFGYYVSQESGRTTCEFSNLWIWELPSD